MLDDHRPVLVATDLSARSDRAVDRAVCLSSSWGKRLILLHAVERGSRLEAQPDLAEKAMRSVLPDPAADVDVMAVAGAAPVTIAQIASRNDCALIVTGVARYNHVGDFLTGTAVDHIVRHASTPVLVVKQRCHGAYSTIVVATDFSSCSRKALLLAARSFPDAMLYLTHAFHVPYEGLLKSEETRAEITAQAQEEMTAFLNAPDVPDDVRARVVPRLAYGETTSAIMQMVREVQADLLVLGTHGRSGFFQAMIGSMAQSLLRNVPADTLMVRGI